MYLWWLAIFTIITWGVGAAIIFDFHAAPPLPPLFLCCLLTSFMGDPMLLPLGVLRWTMRMGDCTSSVRSLMNGQAHTERWHE